MIQKIFNYLKLIRVKHYLKNFLIFLPIVFSGNLFKLNYLYKIIFGFLAFCFVCSIVYIINDIRDLEKDKLHPKKKNRPLASGSISKTQAFIVIAILLASAYICSLFININLYSLLLLVIYLVLNILYSMGLKNVPLVDIIILVSGFVIRVLYGGAIISVEVSKWLTLTIVAMAFYLALGKRRNEISINTNTRNVLKYYNIEFLDKNMYMCLSLAIVFYSLWTVDINVLNRINENVIWTVPLVIMICMRYSMIIEGNSDGDPVEVVVGDKVLLLLLMIYCLILFLMLYL